MGNKVDIMLTRCLSMGRMGRWLTAVVVAILLPVITWAEPVAEPTQPSAADTAFWNRYTYVRFVEDGQLPDTLTDEEFLDMAARIIFPTNRHDLPQDDATLRQLTHDVIPAMNRDSLQLLRMIFRGGASPEGPHDNNARLAAARAQALYDYVCSQMAQPAADSLAAVRIEAEDYALLCLMMERAADPDYKLVRDICQKYVNQPRYGRLKQELQRANGGRLWQRLLSDYFPQLRAARIILYIRKAAQPAQADDITETTTAIGNGEDALSPIDTTAAEVPLYIPRRELLAIKTNLLMYGIYMPGGYNRWCPIPNVAIEYFPLHGHFTYGFSFDMPWWQDYDAHKYFQLRNYQFEARYYFRSGDIDDRPLGEGAAFRGAYLQGYVHTGRFGICFDADHGWVGEGGGAGIGAGYVLQLSRPSQRGKSAAYGHWRLEFGLQAGFFRCRFDHYQYENLINPDYHDNLYYYRWKGKPADFRKRQYRYTWLGPTRIGVTLTYDILYRRNTKNGVSFRNKESVNQ